jgi:Fe-S cluster biosynthesis and repair protein YggX
VDRRRGDDVPPARGTQRPGTVAGPAPDPALRPWVEESATTPELTDTGSNDLETNTCRRCGEVTSPLDRPPSRTELGERSQLSVCPSCWKEWLKHQTQLINHYGLDPREAQARQFLYTQIEQVLLGGGDAEQVDTTQKGNIEW